MKPAHEKWWADTGVLGRIFKTKGALVDAIRSINNSAALNQPKRSFLMYCAITMIGTQKAALVCNILRFE